MSDDYEEWVDVKAALRDLVDGQTFAGETVSAAYRQTVDEYGAPTGDFPEVVIYSATETQSYVDQLDRVTLHIFAPANGDIAQKVARGIVSRVTGEGIETAAGYLDSVRLRNGPELLPYPSEVYDQASVTLEVVSRPL